MSIPKLLGYEELSALTGVKVRALRTYLAKSRAHRAEGNPRPGDLPEPDLTIGKSPVWNVATVEAWLAARPGQGRGGGGKKSPPTPTKRRK